MQNNSEERKAVWIKTPAMPIMKQVAIWLKATKKPLPLSMEGWLRAADLFMRKTSPLN